MSEIMGVHHLNFVVRDLQKSTQHFSNILNQTPVLDELPGRQVLTARYQLNGLWLVLVQPTTTDSEVAQILAERGEGLFLLSLEVPELKAAEQTLSQRGVAMAEKGPRQGLMDWQVWDLNTEAGLGPIIQLCQSLGSKV